MCHMIADSVDELLAMADAIGVNRRHFQSGSFPHFDVSLAYRKRAVAHGAIEVDRRALVAAMKRYRARCASDPSEKARLQVAISMHCHQRPG